MKKTIKKIIITLLAFVVVTMSGFENLETTVARAAVKSFTGAEIADCFNKKIGTSYPDRQCLAFVADVFSSLGAKRDSTCCAYNYGNRHIQSISINNIPLGADVFFGNCGGGPCKSCKSSYYGHIGVYVGNGYFVHATGRKVQKTSLMGTSWKNKYRGWGYHGNINIKEDKSASDQKHKGFILQTGSVLEETGNNFEFCLDDYNKDGIPDLYAIKKNSTGTKKTEVHIIDGASNYKKFLYQAGTCLDETGNNFTFCLSDYNRDGIPDLYAIKKSSTGTRKTEVHVIDGANGYKRFLLQTHTILEETGSNFEFCLGDYNRDGIPDLYAIKKSSTGIKKTEVHIIDGANSYKKFLLQTHTVLEETGNNFEFCLGDYNRDGIPDLYVIKKNSTGTKKTEVHVMDGANGYKRFLYQAGTCLNETGSNFTFCLSDYNRDGMLDLYAIKKSSTGTKKTEVHIF